MFNKKHLIFIALLSTLAVGCKRATENTTGGIDPETGRPTAPQKNQSAEAPNVKWDWNAFPRENTLALGRMKIQIKPKQTLNIKSEVGGVLTIKVDGETSTVKKGYEWALMNAEKLSEAETKLAIKKRQLKLENMKASELELPAKLKAARNDLEKARKRIKLMEAVLKSPAMQEHAADLFDGDISKVSRETLVRAKEDFSLAEKRLAFLETFQEQEQKDAKELGRIEISDDERAYSEAKERSVYTVPFDGELRLRLGLVDGQKDYSVASREIIATLSDFTQIHAHLVVQNVPWISLEPDTLRLRLSDANRTVMPFFQDKVIQNERTRQDERTYIFSVPFQGNQKLKRLVGTQLDGELITQLPEKCWIVPKVKISVYALGKTKKFDWEEVVEALWPGAKVLAVGHSELAISYTPAAK